MRCRYYVQQWRYWTQVEQIRYFFLCRLYLGLPSLLLSEIENNLRTTFSSELRYTDENETMQKGVDLR